MDELSCGDCCLFQKINWRQIIWKYLIPPVDLSKSSKNSHRLNKFTHGVEFTPTVLAMLSDTVALALCVSSSVFPEDRFARLQMMGTKGKYAHLAHCFVWAHRKKKEKKEKSSRHPSFFPPFNLQNTHPHCWSQTTSSRWLRRSSVGALRFSRFSFAGPPAAAAARPYWKHPLEFPEAATAETPLYTHTHVQAQPCAFVFLWHKKSHDLRYS